MLFLMDNNYAEISVMNTLQNIYIKMKLLYI
jgi:hypothetical protein